jgi:hypothetical protein
LKKIFSKSGNRKMKPQEKLEVVKDENGEILHENK